MGAGRFEPNGKDHPLQYGAGWREAEAGVERVSKESQQREQQEIPGTQESSVLVATIPGPNKRAELRLGEIHVPWKIEERGRRNVDLRGETG